MKLRLLTTLGALAYTATLFGSASQAQKNNDTSEIKPAPIILRFNAHSMHANDFQVRRSKDRSLELEIKHKGLDVAFTEWMQRDHPYIFAKACVKQIGEIATAYKSTNHMFDFDKLIEKRPDLRIQANKYGHDVAFAEWLRTERPDVYRQHFGQDKTKKSTNKDPKMDKKVEDDKKIDKE